MLVLTRKEGEAVLIDKDIRIVVLQRKGSSEIRLGFEAPKEIHIVREEIAHREVI